MEYRILPRGGEKISVIGMGSSVIGAQPEEEIIATVRAAVEKGVNFFDMAGGHASIFEAYGKALKGVRDKVYLQVHFGADYTSGEYGWTTDLDEVKASVKWQLEKLQTDYIDFGFIHCLDEEKDLTAYQSSELLDYVQDLKKQGVIRHIGLSSHTPALVNRVLDMGIVDIVMFSVNPVYDYGQGDYGIGSNDDRLALYRRCEKEGVAISVMKPFCGGQLLDAAKSPFKAALSKNQCIRYALDKPGVVTVLPGFGSRREMEEVMEYLTASDEECDYSVISAYTPDDAIAKCVYCRHCHPCSIGLDIALINKYYDLTKLGDNLAREHYMTLDKTASDCVQCGHCSERCPFHVDQMACMQEIAAYFGK
ncbi:MAG: aldo/keto reductase [Christensenellales bacterium]|nr:aldo/keto reductase [Christensenellales bacterium]